MSKPHFLVADPEYIIAMDAERILRELVDCDVTIVAHGVAESQGWGGYSLVILDTDFCCGHLRVLAELLQRQGTPVVFTTASQSMARGVPGFPNTPVVEKPYGAEQLAAAVLPLLADARGANA